LTIFADHNRVLILSIGKLLLELKLISVAILWREIRRLVILSFFVNVSESKSKKKALVIEISTREKSAAVSLVFDKFLANLALFPRPIFSTRVSAPLLI
jgi:hypothetical protein